MHAFPIHRVSFFHDKMTNQVKKLNHFDNSKILFFCESLNTWGGKCYLLLGPFVESINPSSLALWHATNGNNSFPKSTTTLTHIALEGSKNVHCWVKVHDHHEHQNNIEKHILKDAIKNLDEDHEWT
jgi:hypothetical protein